MNLHHKVIREIVIPSMMGHKKTKAEKIKENFLSHVSIDKIKEILGEQFECFYAEFDYFSRVAFKRDREFLERYQACHSRYFLSHLKKDSFEKASALLNELIWESDSYRRQEFIDFGLVIDSRLGHEPEKIAPEFKFTLESLKSLMEEILESRKSMTIEGIYENLHFVKLAKKLLVELRDSYELTPNEATDEFDKIRLMMKATIA